MPIPARATESDGRAIIEVVHPRRDNAPAPALGGWRLRTLLGCGGTAEVWLAVAADGREAAFKMAKPELRGYSAATGLIRREYELLRAVGSPHLVQPYGLVEHDGTLALALEYLPQGDLVPLLGTACKHWIAAFDAVLTGLMSLHRHGVAHGDVKARNVLFASDGSARLIDLTSVQPLDSPAAAATPACSLPVGAQAVGRDADCFALAVLLYELVTGRLPYGREGPHPLAEPLPAVAPADPQARRLLAGAVTALQAGGRVQGLSHFVDVIESAGARQS
jgi:serine/threonine protein kinase